MKRKSERNISLDQELFSKEAKKTELSCYYSIALQRNDYQTITNLVNTRVPIQQNERGITPVHDAANHNDVEALKAFLDGKFSPLATSILTRGGTNPLHSAVYNPEQECPDAIDYLIKKSPDLVTQKDIQGNTPLHIAVLYNRQSAIKALLDARADMHAKNKRGKTPYVIAQITQHVNGAFKLLEQWESQKNQKATLDFLESMEIKSTKMQEASSTDIDSEPSIPLSSSSSESSFTNELQGEDEKNSATINNFADNSDMDISSDSEQNSDPQLTMQKQIAKLQVEVNRLARWTVYQSAQLNAIANGHPIDPHHSYYYNNLLFFERNRAAAAPSMIAYASTDVITDEPRDKTLGS